MLWAALTRPFLNTSLSFDLSPKFCAPPVTLIKSFGFCNFQQLNSTWVIWSIRVFWPTRMNFYFYQNETDIIIISFKNRFFLNEWYFWNRILIIIEANSAKSIRVRILNRTRYRVPFRLLLALRIDLMFFF